LFYTKGGYVAKFDQFYAGVAASVGDVSDDYFVTGDGSWKCTTDYYDDWMKTSFGDSLWLPAVIADGPFPSVPPVSGSADYIWTSRLPIDRVVYCRGYLREFVLYMVARKLRRWSLLGRHGTMPRDAAWRRMYRRL